MNHSFNTIFWDNDGTLVDTEHLYFQANQEAMLQLGIEVSLADYVKHLLLDNKGVWFMASDLGHSDSEIATLKNWRNNRYKELIQTNLKVFDNAEQVLAALSLKFKMSIVTSSLKDHFDIIHSQTNILKYMEFVVSNDDYKESKPNPEPYLVALNKSKALREECLAIEDSARGLRSAKAAGISCWVIPTPLTKDSNFSEADKIVSSLDELQMLLLGNAK